MADSKDETKIEVILNAAQNRFAHYGLAKTTMNDIAQDIGMSKAALYYYFPDKQQLFQQVIAREQQDFIERMKGLLKKDGKASSLMMEYVDLRLKFFQTLLNLSKLRYDSIMAYKPVFGNLLKNFKETEINFIRDILKRGVASGEFEINNVKEKANLFVEVMLGLRAIAISRQTTSVLHAEDYARLESYLKDFTKIFVKGIAKKS